MDAGQASTPRITVSELEGYRGKTVMIVGKVLSIRGEHVEVDAGGKLNAQLNPEGHIFPNNGVQFIAKVNPDLSVKVLSSLDLGPDVDYGLANKVVQISQQFKDLYIYN